MKKVVNGQVYDTNLATLVTSWNEETKVTGGVKVKVSVVLNRKYVLKEDVAPEDALEVTSWGSVLADKENIDEKRGEFFLLFEAAPGDEESKRIVPVSDDQAKEIVEKRCSFADYVRWFGDPRGLVVTPDTVKKAVDRQRSHDYDEKMQIKKERDAAEVRISELEDRIRELENR